MQYAYLETVKAMLGITGTYQDTALLGYVTEVIDYMVSAGVSRTTANSERAVGIVTRGVSDLWNYGSGGTTLSPYFHNRVIQLCYESKEDEPDEPGSTDVIAITKEEIDRVMND